MKATIVKGVVFIAVYKYFPSIIFFIVMMFGFLNGCRDRELSAPLITEPPQTTKPFHGKFSFAHLNGISDITPITNASFNSFKKNANFESNDFDLGPIGNTTNFYFLLLNTGGSTIYGITISVSNPSFQISPVTIDSLQAGISVSLFPIVRLTAIHGSTITGIGMAPLMPQGTNMTTLNISGQTQDSTGGLVTISLAGTIKVFAHIMDIKLYDGVQEVDLSNPSSARLNMRMVPDPFPVLQVGNTDVSIRNTGNVPITIIIWYEPHGFDPTVLIPQHTIAVGASETLPDSIASLYYSLSALDLSSGGIISDRTRLPIARNGHVYIGLTPR